MGYDIGALLLGEQVAKRMVAEALYGKPQPKKQSFFSKILKRRTPVLAS